MAPRFFIDQPLGPVGQEVDLPPGATRHTQVLRLQPGQRVTLFDGRTAQEWQAEVLSMTRAATSVRLLAAEPVSRELPVNITLAVVMPANDRMDFLVEKATELGVAAIQPLTSERSVLRLSGERAAKKVAHWQGVANAATEQCGRARVPRIHPVLALSAYLAEAPPSDQRLLASPAATGRLKLSGGSGTVVFLSGPEGGLTQAEAATAIANGFEPTSLGPRILRADTAPLTFLAWASLSL